jgi:dUTPase
MQEKLKLKLKKTHPNSVLPSYAKDGDAGLDLTAASFEFLDTEHY